MAAHYAVSAEGSISRRLAVISNALPPDRGRVTLCHWDSAWSDPRRGESWYEGVPAVQKAFLSAAVAFAADGLWALAPRLMGRLLTDPAGTALGDEPLSVSLYAKLLQEAAMPSWAWAERADLIAGSDELGQIGGIALAYVDGEPALELSDPTTGLVVLRPDDRRLPAAKALVRALLGEPAAAGLLTGLAEIWAR